MRWREEGGPAAFFLRQPAFRLRQQPKRDSWAASGRSGPSPKRPIPRSLRRTEVTDLFDLIKTLPTASIMLLRLSPLTLPIQASLFLWITARAVAASRVSFTKVTVSTLITRASVEKGEKSSHERKTISSFPAPLQKVSEPWSEGFRQPDPARPRYGSPSSRNPFLHGKDPSAGSGPLRLWSEGFRSA